MSFEQCVIDQIKQRGLGKKKADAILKRFRNRYDAFQAQGMPEADARAAAEQDALLRYDLETKMRKGRMLENMKGQQKVRDELHAIAKKDGRKLPEAIMAYAERIPGYEQIVGTGEAIEVAKRQLGNIFFPLANEYGRKGLGITRKQAGLENVLRELFAPNSTGDNAAALLAKAFRDTADMGVSMFKKAGGSIYDRKDWFIPQHMDKYRLWEGVDPNVADKAQEFADRMMDRLDWNKMMDPDGAVIPPNKREEVLKYVWETRATDGQQKKFTSAYAQKAVGNQTDNTRFLVLKDADAWLAMHQDYGKGNIMDVMVGHMEHMAHNIGVVRALGPNPSNRLDFIKRTARYEAAQLDAAKKGGKRKEMLSPRLETAIKRLDDEYAVISRENRMPDANMVGAVGAGARNILTSSLLGGAYLLALPGDLRTVFQTNKFLGLPSTRFIGEYIKGFNPLSSADRARATRIVGNLESMTSQMLAASRYTQMEEYGPAWTRYISDVMLRANLLSPHTQIARNSFEIDFMETMTEYAGRSFDQLDERLQSAFQMYGFDAAKWDKFRQTPARDGVIQFNDVWQIDGETAETMTRMMVSESKMAVPQSTYRAQTFLTGDTMPGTVPGEVLKSFGMFKNFPTTILQTHGKRGLQLGVEGGRWGYLAAYMLGLGAAGALGLQMKQIAAGKDPMDMTDPRFYGAAMLSGGALGIFGDFMFSDVNRFGGGVAQTVAGPPAQLINDVRNLSVGNMMELIEGKDTKFLSELNRFAGRYFPGQNTFYLKLVLDRMVTDQIAKAVDPKAHSKFKRNMTMAEKDTGQKFWWKQGETSASRGPDWMAAFGQ